MTVLMPKQSLTAIAKASGVARANLDKSRGGRRSSVGLEEGSVFARLVGVTRLILEASDAHHLDPRVIAHRRVNIYLVAGNQEEAWEGELQGRALHVLRGKRTAGANTRSAARQCAAIEEAGPQRSFDQRSPRD